MKKKKEEKFNKGEILIYKPSKNEVELRVRFKEEMVWLKQQEIADLFDKDRSVITKHINKIFKDKEIDQKSNVHFLRIANSDKPVAFYSLDVILAIGYRTNSSRAIHFRQWATKILKRYLLKGYVVNQKQLLEAKKKLLWVLVRPLIYWLALRKKSSCYLVLLKPQGSIFQKILN